MKGVEMKKALVLGLIMMMLFVGCCLAGESNNNEEIDEVINFFSGDGGEEAVEVGGDELYLKIKKNNARKMMKMGYELLATNLKDKCSDRTFCSVFERSPCGSNSCVCIPMGIAPLTGFCGFRRSVSV